MGREYLDFRANSKKRKSSSQYFFDSVNEDNIELTITTAVERGEVKSERAIQSQPDFEEELRGSVRIGKQLSSKDLIMMEGISNQKMRREKTHKRGPLFAWNTFDKYGDIFFEDKMKSPSDSSVMSVLSDCESA